MLSDPAKIKIVEAVIWIFNDLCSEEIEMDLDRISAFFASYNQACAAARHTTEGKLPGTVIFLPLLTVQFALLRSSTCIPLERDACNELVKTGKAGRASEGVTPRNEGVRPSNEEATPRNDRVKARNEGVTACNETCHLPISSSKNPPNNPRAKSTTKQNKTATKTTKALPININSLLCSRPSFADRVRREPGGTVSFPIAP